MVLGKGLESLIPPRNPFDPSTDSGSPRAKSRGENPQDNLEDNPSLKQGQLRGEKSLLPETSGSERARFDSPLAERERAEDKQAPRWGAQRVEGEDLLSPDKEDTPPKESVFQIETDKIAPNPHQPRRHFDEIALGELANSVREFGIIQPLVVTKIEKESPRGWEVTYELVAGERRLMAAKLLGLQTVPAIVRQVPVEHEKLELAVTENVQRTNLNPIELARAVAKLQEDFKLTQREIAARLGKSREVIANTLRLLSLPSNIQEAVATGKISESQARLLLSVDDAAAQERIFQEILTDSLTTREVSHRVRQLKVGAPLGARVVDPDLMALKEELEAALGAPVELKREGEGGKLTINFYSKEELEGILAKFKDRQTP